MRRLAALLVAAVALLSAASRADVPDPDSGGWTIRGLHGAKIDFELRVRTASGSGEWSDDVPLAEFERLSSSQLESSDANVRFEVVRDAGLLECVGHLAGGIGGGTFRYVANPNYPAKLAAFGVSAPTVAEQRRMTYNDVSLRFVETLRRNRVAVAAPGDLIRLAEHGVSPEFVEQIGGLGYRFDSSEDLVRLVDHGVSVRYIEALRALGYRPAAMELVRMVDHGVSTTLVEATRSLGQPATVDDFVRLADHGVGADFARGIRSLGYHPTVRQLVTLADHGVNLEFVRKAAARGEAENLDNIVRLRDAGL